MKGTIMFNYKRLIALIAMVFIALTVVLSCSLSSASADGWHAGEALGQKGKVHRGEALGQGPKFHQGQASGQKGNLRFAHSNPRRGTWRCINETTVREKIWEHRHGEWVLIINRTYLHPERCGS